MGEEIVRLHVVGDGTAFSYRLFSEDLSCEIEPTVRWNLRTKSYFSECSNDPSPLNRFDCVRNALIGDPLETCTDYLGCD